MVNSIVAHYRIVSKLGEGGMGVVYRATDTKLQRDVALKFLPEELATDPARRSRFEREAQVLAALNHPHIAAVYGLEDSAIVMELVEGPTLADRIAAGPIQVDEAIAIARQIADAMEAAHEKGIIHRDLKPANVKLTADGQVKVLDFGLAKALEDPTTAQDSNPAHSPTLVAGRSLPGLILGTASYMSPEQARGSAVDKRTDIWAFGVVLYEMLTAKQLFVGETISDTLAQVLTKEPDLSAIPARVRPLLQRCLERDRKKRLRDIGDAFGIEETAPPAPVVEVRRGLPWAWAIPAVALFVASGAIAGWLLRSTPELPLRAFAFTPKSIPNTNISPRAAISPDGKHLAYVAEGKLWVRELASEQPRSIEGSDEAEGPFWSPDSTQIVFSARRELKKVPVAGGLPFVLAKLDGDFRGGSWSPEGNSILVCTAGEGLSEIPATGGVSKVVVASGAAGTFYNPQALPASGGKRFAVAGKGLLYFQSLELIDLDTGQSQTIRQPGANPTWSPSGYILYQTDGQTPGLWALPFSPKTGKVMGEPRPVLNAGSSFSTSAEGTLVWVDLPQRYENHLVWRDRTGRKLADTGPPQRGIPSLAISPDGTKAAYAADERNNVDIWIADLTRSTRSRITFGPELDHHPAWSPSGNEIVFASVRSDGVDIVVHSADGRGQQRAVVAGRPRARAPVLSPDGTTLLFSQNEPKTKLDLWIARRRADGSFEAPSIWLQSPHAEGFAGFSPDGRFVVYESDESGRREVYVRPLERTGGKWQISTEGGTHPRWSRDGKEIFYLERNRLMAVPVKGPADTVQPGAPTELFTMIGVETAITARPYDVASDGKRFLVAEPTDTETTPASIHVIQNWPALLGKAKEQP